MFVQVIQGKVKDPAALEDRLQRWRGSLASGASGYTGSTGGVTADGTAIVLACFDSEESARQNSDRPEQGAWWAETEKLFDGPVTFRDTTEVDIYLGGTSDTAGFVQVMQGTVTDRERYAELFRQSESEMTQLRPDILGGLTAWFGDDYVEAIYFTSEAEARAGERRMSETEMPPEAREFMDLSRNTTYYDLTTPLITSVG